jgi:hypothetical protein
MSIFSRFFSSGSAVFLALGVSISVSFAQSSQADLKALEAAVRKEGDEQQKKAGSNGERYDMRAMGASVIGQLRNAVSRGDSQQAEEALNQLLPYFRSETVMEAATKLREQLMAERATRDKSCVTQLRSAIDFAGKAVKSANKPADLDEALRRLTDVRWQSDDRNSEVVRAEINKVQNARQFVLNWQDYLSARDAGDMQRALSSLRSAGSMDTADLMPRSEVLARIETFSKQPGKPEPSLRQIVGGSVTLAGLPAAIEVLNRVIEVPGSTHRSSDDPVFMLREQLRALKQTYEVYEAGMPSRFVVGDNGYGRAPNEEVSALVTPPKIELMRIVFPIYLGVSEKPKASETVQAYLDRMLADASSRLDAVTMGKVLELKLRLEGRTEQIPAVIQTLIAAGNQEEAGQFTPAVISYQFALQAGGEIVPAKEIGIRLAAIKSAHPEEYAAAMKQFTSGTAYQPSFYRSSSNGPAIIIPGSGMPVKGE